MDVDDELQETPNVIDANEGVRKSKTNQSITEKSTTAMQVATTPTVVPIEEILKEQLVEKQ